MYFLDILLHFINPKEYIIIRFHVCIKHNKLRVKVQPLLRTVMWQIICY